MTPAADVGLLREVAERLAHAGVASAEAEARLLVEHVAQVAGDAADARSQALLDGLVARRCRREPLQLVLGRTWFRQLELSCTPGVFIPRPETEIVAGLAIAAASRLGAPLVVEPCCGTGAIALSVAVEVAGARVVATDADARAVAACCANLDRVVAGQAGVPGLAPGARVEVAPGALLDGVDQELRGRVDVMVANPPYLPAADRVAWEPEVADHDPIHALVGGPDGHEVVDTLLALAPTWLAPGGTVVIEIDERRGSDAASAATGAGLVDVRVEQDLAGADRALVAVCPG